MTALKKIQIGMSWAVHVKKESLDGAAQNPADTCCPSDDKWYYPPAPQLHCEFISYVEAPKKSNYVDKPVGPNASIALGGSFFRWGTCLRTATDLVGPDCPLSTYSPLQIPLICLACSQWQIAASRPAHKGVGGDPTKWGSALLLTKLLN